MLTWNWKTEIQIVIPRRSIRPDHDISFTKKIAFGMFFFCNIIFKNSIILGIGHFYNDLCASMWFTYFMIYMEKVLKFQSSRAGMLMLIGQVIKNFWKIIRKRSEFFLLILHLDRPIEFFLKLNFYMTCQFILLNNCQFKTRFVCFNP